MRSATALTATVSLDEILSRPDVWCADRLATAPIPTVASGFAELDAELPGGGWPRGALTEILVERVGIGECSLLLPALARMRAENRWLLLIAPPYRINAPAWANGGVDVRTTETRTHTGAVIAVHNLVEQVIVAGRGGPEVVACVATNVYVKHASGWRILLHHSGLASEDPPPVASGTVLH